jgi:hypothetical protein
MNGRDRPETWIKLNLRERGRKVGTGIMWLRIGTSGGLLWTLLLSVSLAVTVDL